ncbi:YidC/Oxa1 family membrane protein insertase [Treponema sp. TIM-1]|uniref:YidC/Oxa1 family membrane protein insertase n=1 Tax=Treponema sp. TIM-1 TaxID=2898417 RepID=UPI00397EEC11
MVDILYTVIIYPLKTIFEVVFVFARLTFKDTGISVIFISIAISLLCLPLYNVAESWQRLERETQKRMKTKIDKIRAVFKGDEQYLILSAYYRQNHYHPVYTMRSTFGLLIQIPFFIAAYSFLSHNEALKGTSFLFISDLSLPDRLISLGGVQFNSFPVIMALINCAAALIYTKGFPLKEKLPLYGTALIFLLLLYNSPSGLLMYWIGNNCFSLIKHLYDKIHTDFKKIVLRSLISLLCFAMIYYVLAVHRGNPRVRHIFAVMLLLLSIMLWIIPVLKRNMQKAAGPDYPVNRLFLFFILSCAVLCMITGLFLPSMLVASSPQEFSYIDNHTPLFFVFNTFAQAFGFFIFWPLCFFFLFSTKKTLAMTGLLFCVTALCNVFLFPGNYGILSIDMVFENGVNPSVYEILVNIAILCIPIGIMAFLFLKGFYKIIFPAAALSGIVFLVLSIRNIAFIQTEFQKTSEFHLDKKTEVSVEPVFHFSKTGKNTVVLMLDRATSSFVPFILEELPELKDRYAGFVYYPNTLSFNGYTRLGAPPIFGGYEYIPTEFNKRDTVPVVKKHNEALLLMPLIFSRAGYQVTVTDPPYPNYSYKEDLRLYDPYPEIKARITDAEYTAIWLKEHTMVLPSQGDVLKRNILWYGILKIVPLFMREGIYQQGGWFASLSGYKLTNTLNGYSVLDFLPRLTDTRAEKENTALIMVNNTTHNPSLMQAPDYRPAINVTNYGKSPYAKESEYHGNAAALLRLADWFSFLKQENIYDNTRIIIVADHGAQKNYVSPMSPGFSVNIDNFNPLLLVKDFYASGSIRTDHTFMTNADVPFLAFQGQIENPVNPFTGREISVELKNYPLYVACSGGIHLENPEATRITLEPDKDYYVHDTIFDPANWEKAEK